MPLPPAPLEAPVRAIGLMSGTSADGIDAALVTIAERGGRPGATLDHFVALPYPEELVARIHDAFENRLGPREICLLNGCLGELFAEAAVQVAREAGVAFEKIEFVASHGQTVWHQPEAEPFGGRSVRGTLQLGEPAVIAERTGCTVVADFRPRDMAAGGEGAPLVPYVDYLLFSHRERTRAVQNIGGIGNVTYLPAGPGPEAIVAFDTGPGNALIDAAVARITGGRERQDTDGRMARRGGTDEEVLLELLAHPYFDRPPPKSTGRELFGAAFLDRIWGRLHLAGDPERTIATLTQFTASSIRRSYEQWLLPRGAIDEVIVGGGGARNPVLMEAIERAVAPARVVIVDELGIPADAKEAVAFALLGYETLRGRPSNVPAATGARHAVLLGKIIPGSR